MMEAVLTFETSTPTIHGAIFLKTITFILIAVGASNLTQL
jgi:hypothetical protein